MKFVELLFFHIYRSQINSGETGMPVASAVLGLSLVLFMNILSLVIIVDILGISTLMDIFNSYPVVMALSVGFGLFGLILFWFYHGKRYEKIIKEFSKRSEQQRQRAARITLFYALASIISVFILAPLRMM